MYLYKQSIYRSEKIIYIRIGLSEFFHFHAPNIAYIILTFFKSSFKTIK